MCCDWIANIFHPWNVWHTYGVWPDYAIGNDYSLSLQVYGDEEWSFGFCEQGTGVFSCPPTKNPMYTFRESIILGKTSFPNSKVNQIVRELSREWPGHSYDLLSKNCNHFCDELCERLGVPKLPGKGHSMLSSINTSILLNYVDNLKFLIRYYTDNYPL